MNRMFWQASRLGTVLLVVYCGCARITAPETVNVDHVEQELLAEGKSPSCDLSGTEVVGFCSADTLRQLAAALGRIPGGRSVTKLWVLWPECEIGAKALIGRDFVYLSRNRSGKWEFVGSARLVDSVDVGAIGE